jgi:hypothetical protein
LSMLQASYMLYTYILRRQILDAQDHADRVLMTGRYRLSLLRNEERIGAKTQIINYINSQTHRSAYYFVYEDELLKDFTVLPLYITLQDLAMFKNTMINDYNNLLSAIDKLRHANEVTKLINDLNNFAKDVQKNGYEKGVKDLRVSRYEGVILMHHADLSKELRSRIEAHIKGQQYPVPQIIMSTSTLELGVDIEHVPVIVQYAPEPLPAELTQRMGRSGRSLESLYVSTLILVLRNTGEDLAYTRDQEAVEYVYNFSAPKTVNIYEYSPLLLRHITQIYIDICVSNSFTDAICNVIDKTLQNLLSALKNMQIVRDSRYDILSFYELWKNNVKTLGKIQPSTTLSAKASVYQQVMQQLRSVRGILNQILNYCPGAIDQQLANKLDRVLESIERGLSTSTRTQTFIYRNIASHIRRLFNTLNEIYSNISVTQYQNVGLANLLSNVIQNIMSIIVTLLEIIDQAFQKPYAILQDLTKKRRNKQGALIILLDDEDVREYFAKRIYIYDLIEPGIASEIGEIYCHHILIHYAYEENQKGEKHVVVKLGSGSDFIDVLSKARPLHTQRKEV